MLHAHPRGALENDLENDRARRSRGAEGLRRSLARPVRRFVSRRNARKQQVKNGLVGRAKRAMKKAIHTVA